MNNNNIHSHKRKRDHYSSDDYYSQHKYYKDKRRWRNQRYNNDGNSMHHWTNSYQSNEPDHHRLNNFDNRHQPGCSEDFNNLSFNLNFQKRYSNSAVPYNPGSLLNYYEDQRKYNSRYNKSFQRQHQMRNRPDRWDKYKDIGEQIPGTQFIAFKTPLSIDYFNDEEESFTTRTLLERMPTIGLVIDLTFKRKGYYEKNYLSSKDIDHHHIRVPGKIVPPYEYVQDFYKCVDKFLMNENNRNKLIGVHCTHGLNRTGYMICRYMIERLGICPQESIETFNTARGHPQERKEYTNHLKTIKTKRNASKSNGDSTIKAGNIEKIKEIVGTEMTPITDVKSSNPDKPEEENVQKANKESSNQEINCKIPLNR